MSTSLPYVAPRTSNPCPPWCTERAGKATTTASTSGPSATTWRKLAHPPTLSSPEERAKISAWIMADETALAETAWRCGWWLASI